MASHRCWCCKTIAVIICLLSRPLGWWVAGGSFSGPGVGQVFTVTLRVDLSFAARAVAAPVECGGARCLGVGWVDKWELKWYGGLWRGICSANTVLQSGTSYVYWSWPPSVRNAIWAKDVRRHTRLQVL
jgi:hypothetical protein